MKSETQERRRTPRRDFPSHLAVNLLQPQTAVASNGINVSQGGLCLRLHEALEVRSLVRLQLTPEARVARSPVAKGGQAVQCTGRVAWVIQRLDLRDVPPFLYDVGIEFVDPPPVLRRLLARTGASFEKLTRSMSRSLGELSAPGARGLQAAGTARQRALGACVIRGRRFVANLQREPEQPPRWHLIITVDAVPCFSGRYASEREATAAWARFRRQQARR